MQFCGVRKARDVVRVGVGGTKFRSSRFRSQGTIHKQHGHLFGILPSMERGQLPNPIPTAPIPHVVYGWPPMQNSHAEICMFHKKRPFTRIGKQCWSKALISWSVLPPRTDHHPGAGGAVPGECKWINRNRFRLQSSSITQRGLYKNRGTLYSPDINGSRNYPYFVT